LSIFQIFNIFNILVFYNFILLLKQLNLISIKME